MSGGRMSGIRFVTQSQLQLKSGAASLIAPKLRYASGRKTDKVWVC